jgi:Protein of unknown function (DUF3108)
LKKALIFCLFLWFGAAFSPTSLAAQVKYDACYMPNTTFQGGEELVYKIYYNWNFVWLAAGEVVCKVSDDGNQYHINAKGNTYPSYEWFFVVDDNFNSFIDKNSLLPFMATRRMSEGNYRLYDKIVFDQTNHNADFYKGSSEQDMMFVKNYALNGCMHDVLSIIYYCRNIDFEQLAKGQEIPVKIFLDKETYPLRVKYKGKNPRKLVRDNGYFKTLQFSPQAVAGAVFSENTQMNVWVSDDANRIPLLIESPVSVGSVKIVLKNYKGLKYDFGAKVN